MAKPSVVNNLYWLLSCWLHWDTACKTHTKFCSVCANIANTVVLALFDSACFELQQKPNKSPKTSQYTYEKTFTIRKTAKESRNKHKRIFDWRQTSWNIIQCGFIEAKFQEQHTKCEHLICVSANQERTAKESRKRTETNFSLTIIQLCQTKHLNREHHSVWTSSYKAKFQEQCAQTAKHEKRQSKLFLFCANVHSSMMVVTYFHFYCSQRKNT